MKERPILFSGEMVRAILAGTKTQTRRVLKKQPLDVLPMNYKEMGKQGWVGRMEPDKGTVFACRYGTVGDRLWVRESWWQRGGTTTDVDGEWHFVKRLGQCKENVAYRADHEYAPAGEYMYDTWRPMPSIFMPRWASRLTLELTAVRVERVQDISTADACAEGIPGCRDDLPNAHAVVWYKALWDSLNAKRGYSWESNPWVFVLSFKVVQP